MPGIEHVVYGGHYREKMHELLNFYRGTLTPELFMKLLIPEMAMKSNFQNVIYDPQGLQFWVNNAKSKKERAAEQDYTFFDFGKALKNFPNPSTYKSVHLVNKPRIAQD